MALITQLAVFGSIAWIVRFIYRTFFAHHPLDNIPGPKPTSLVTGDLSRLFHRLAWDFHKTLIYEYGPVSVVRGLFGARMVYVFDPKALHNIVVKDQHIYEETPVTLTFNRLFFGESLLSSLGEQHRHQRKILNPVFNINHMRHMTPIFYRVSQKLRGGISKQIASGNNEVDVLNWMTRTALELVGQGGLGTSFDTLERPEVNALAEYIKAFTPTVGPLFLLMRIVPFLTRIVPPAFSRRFLEFLPWKRVHKSMEISDAIYETARAVLESKRTALASGDEAVSSQISEGKDIISVLLKAQTSVAEEDKMSDTELLGQMSALLFAAMETTSGALARILHKLAQCQDIQEKLRQELIAARGGRDNIPYDELVSLPYLDALCRESLRLYPPLITLSRATTQDIVMPLSNPIRGKNGQMINEIPLPKNTTVMMGLWGSNINPAVWGEDAEEFKPERWLSNLPDTVTDAHIPGVYANLMTFLGGGRACIGFKFSQLEMKVVLSILIEHFRFELPDKEIYWNCTGIQYPSIGRVDEKGQLPLRVTLVKSS
ncbi:hypothetical protein QCA50_000152 [Cerrena zonata]|uniref:Cytochrome P450 n=1 Tax=Cerrena zonata TaxID=2478898 RepID=A0AAW0GSA7_9APHY